MRRQQKEKRDSSQIRKLGSLLNKVALKRIGDLRETVEVGGFSLGIA